MKQRKIEWVVIAVTLAFAFFTGGYLLGRAKPAGISGTGGGPVVITARSGTEALPAPDVPPAYAEADTSAPEPPEESALTVFYGKININTASRAELTDLPGIGEALADRIVAYREQNGPFESAADIADVSGIGEKKLEAILDYITVG